MSLLQLPAILAELRELDFPHLDRYSLSNEPTPRLIVLCHDGHEYAVSVHSARCDILPRIYYHGSRTACVAAYREMLRLCSENPLPASN